VEDVATSGTLLACLVQLRYVAKCTSEKLFGIKGLVSSSQLYSLYLGVLLDHFHIGWKFKVH